MKMLFVDDVQQGNIIVQNVLNCLDNVVEMMELIQLMVVESLIVEFDPMINLMNHKHLHQIMLDQSQEFHYLNVLNIVQPKSKINLK
jgi:hypothetical protein